MTCRVGFRSVLTGAFGRAPAGSSRPALAPIQLVVCPTGARRQWTHLIELSGTGLQQKTRVGSAKSETIGEYGVQLREPGSCYNRQAHEVGIEFVDVDRRRYEVMLEHAYAKDR